MAVALVQQKGNWNDTGLTTVATLDSTATAGNVLIGVACSCQNAGATILTTPGGYTNVKEYGGAAGDPPRVAIYAKLAVGNETNFTATHDGAVKRLTCWVGEFSGVNTSLTADGTASQASADAATATTFDSGTITTTTAGSLVVAAIGYENTTADVTAVEAGGYTPATMVNDTSGAASVNRIKLNVYYRISAAGAYREQPTRANAAQYAGVQIGILAAAGAAAGLAGGGYTSLLLGV